ncbi:MAG: hypothetical protein ABSA16_19000 [Thermoguttaceae bacterium]
MPVAIVKKQLGLDISLYQNSPSFRHHPLRKNANFTGILELQRSVAEEKKHPVEPVRFLLGSIKAT